MVVHAIYASTSGNVEIVVETAAEILKAQGVEVVLHRSEMTSIDIINQNSVFILATSTWEHGVLNPFFNPLHQAMASQDLKGKQAVFIGCGDNRYEPVLFNQGVKMLHTTWLKQGGQELYRMCLINGEPYHQLDSVVKPWATELAAIIKGGAPS